MNNQRKFFCDDELIEWLDKFKFLYGKSHRSAFIVDIIKNFRLWHELKGEDEAKATAQGIDPTLVCCGKCGRPYNP